MAAGIDQASSLPSTATNTLPSLPGLGPLTGALQGSLSNLLNSGTKILDRLLPPPQREALKQKLTRFAVEKPYLASFLLSQVAFSGLPMFLFVILIVSVAVFALIVGLLVGLLGAVLFILAAVAFALIVLLPILFFTTFAAVGVWLFGVGAWYIVKHFGQAQGQAGIGELGGVTKATGLDGLVSGLGLNADTSTGEGQQKAEAAPQTNGATGEKERNRPPKLKGAEDGVEQHGKRSTGGGGGKQTSELKTAATGHVKNASQGVGSLANGVGNAAGIDL